MNLIQRISSTLKTWVFKKKLLKFSGRFRVEPEACFYCPEMCRFSCPVAETLRDNTVTPRGKMSLLHLAERGYSAGEVAGTAENRLWVLEQCSGCGRCTEYCVYENDVASNLRMERARYFEGQTVAMAAAGAQATKTDPLDLEALLDRLRELEGAVLLAEPGRGAWWRDRPRLLEELGVKRVFDGEIPHREWSWGKLAAARVEAIGQALGKCRQLWVESPELAWFLAKGAKEEQEALRADVRVVWQRFFADFAALELPVGTSFHESWHLSRNFPRLGISIPMYERGLLPFHSGWNVWDCGGEGHYKQAHPEYARRMAERFLQDVVKDGRPLEKIVCQCLSCADHLRGVTDAKVTYWLDELFEAKHGSS